jgi:hypothetical protein
MIATCISEGKSLMEFLCCGAIGASVAKGKKKLSFKAITFLRLWDFPHFFATAGVNYLIFS